MRCYVIITHTHVRVTTITFMYEKTIWSFLFYYVDLKITLDGIDRLKKKKKTVIVSQFESHGEKKK